jgi:hypothetical protein
MGRPTIEGQPPAPSSVRRRSGGGAGDGPGLWLERNGGAQRRIRAADLYRCGNRGYPGAHGKVSVDGTESWRSTPWPEGLSAGWAIGLGSGQDLGRLESFDGLRKSSGGFSRPGRGIEKMSWVCQSWR